MSTETQRSPLFEARKDMMTFENQEGVQGAKNFRLDLSNLGLGKISDMPVDEEEMVKNP